MSEQLATSAEPNNDPRPAERYATALAAERATVAACGRLGKHLSNARLAIFALGAAGAVFAFQGAAAGPWVLGGAILAFIVLAVWHEQVIARELHAERAISFYQRGLARIEHRFAGTGQSGSLHAPDHHPYASDLDLFGEGSLFEWLCTARTIGGEARLAQWLLEPATPATIAERATAIAELCPRDDLRKDWALLAEDVRVELHPETFEAWGVADTLGLTRTHAVIAAVLAALGALSLAAWVAGASPLWLLLVITADLGFAAAVRERVAAVLKSVETPARQLSVLSGLMARLEDESFESPPLIALRNRLGQLPRPPSREIDRLRQLLEVADSRRNMFFAPIAGLLLWGTQFACAIERWRERVGPLLPEWVDVLSEIEALLCLAGNAWEQEDAIVPIVQDGPPQLDASGLGHPLLPSSTRIRNDITISPEQPLFLVSGSNMSGKSTWLRTLGINLVLAQAGARVCAEQFSCSPLAVGASIRIVDSLQEGASHFYAEIQRLKVILDLVDAGQPTLFLLDEILHGTNSRDRAKGADSVVTALIERGAIGLVTTHDLALASIAEQLGARARNVHFQDRLEDGEMIFDYRVRDGIVERSNALDLMRSIGLPID